VLIRGYNIAELMENKSFSDVAFLVLFGRLPNKAESTLMNAIMVACVDHGMAPCAMVTHIIRYGAPESFQSAIAGGILSLGDIHGGAIEKSAKMLQESVKRAREEKKSIEEMGESIVHERWVEGEIIHGIGHPIHRLVDPRQVKLFEIAEREGYKKDHCKLLEAIGAAAKKAYGRTLPINVDGAIAAVISDMGIDWKLGKAFFIISRVVGLAAHAYEHMGDRGDAIMRALRQGAAAVEYDGPQERCLPAES
jgi:citrate synthase